MDPVALISEEKIEISDWELQDFCVQIVRDKITEAEGTILSWNSHPEVMPSLFFIDKDQEQHLVIVCSARYPHSPRMPENVREIRNSVSDVTSSGYLAMVTLASTEDPYDPNAADNGNFLPLYRGHPCYIKFDGLTPLNDQH